MSCVPGNFDTDMSFDLLPSRDTMLGARRICLVRYTSGTLQDLHTTNLQAFIRNPMNSS